MYVSSAINLIREEAKVCICSKIHIKIFRREQTLVSIRSTIEIMLIKLIEAPFHIHFSFLIVVYFSFGSFWLDKCIT